MKGLVFYNFFLFLQKGLAKADGYTDEPEICSIIKEAMKRRQKTIVNPTLFECAMNGDGDRLYSTLEEGDDVNPLTGTGDWPLYMAVGNGYLKILQLLHMVTQVLSFFSLVAY